MKKRKGLTLIEVLLSMTIIGVVAVLVITVFGFSLRSIRHSDKRTETILDLEDQLNKEILSYENEQEDIIKVIFSTPDIKDQEIKGKLIFKGEGARRITTFVPSKDQD